MNDNSAEKQFVCRKCSLFLDVEDLKDGKCPDCEEDDNLFENDLLNE